MIRDQVMSNIDQAPPGKSHCHGPRKKRITSRQTVLCDKGGRRADDAGVDHGNEPRLGKDGTKLGEQGEPIKR